VRDLSQGQESSGRTKSIETTKQGSHLYSTHSDFLNMYHKDEIVNRTEEVVWIARTVSIRMRTC